MTRKMMSLVGECLPGVGALWRDTVPARGSPAEAGFRGGGGSEGGRLPRRRGQRRRLPRRVRGGGFRGGGFRGRRATTGGLWRHVVIQPECTSLHSLRTGRLWRGHELREAEALLKGCAGASSNTVPARVPTPRHGEGRSTIRRPPGSGAGARGAGAARPGRGVYGIQGTTAGGRRLLGTSAARRRRGRARRERRGRAVQHRCRFRATRDGRRRVASVGGVGPGASRSGRGGFAAGSQGVVAGGSRGSAAAGSGGAVAGHGAYGASAYRPYGFNAYGGYHQGWVHGYWNGHDNAAWGWRNNFWGGGWGGAWGLGMGLGMGLGWGLSSWGFGSTLYGMGYMPYVNPYYGGGRGRPAAVTAPYDYSQPINTVAAPADDSVTNPAMALFDAGRASFTQGNYTNALQQADDALAKLPNDTTLHEFRALCLFALGRYDEAAATLYAVLSVGPGWDWTTLVGLYPSVDVYTTQLRALEDYCGSHPDSASAPFVLAYHYLTQGHTDSAVSALKQVVALKPGDTLSSKLLRQLDPPKERPRADGRARDGPRPGQHGRAARRVDRRDLECPAGRRHRDRPDRPARRRIHLAGHAEGPRAAILRHLHLRRGPPHPGPGQRPRPGRPRELDRRQSYDVPHRRRRPRRPGAELLEVTRRGRPATTNPGRPRPGQDLKLGPVYHGNRSDPRTAEAGPESPTTARRTKSAETGSRLRRRIVRCTKVLGILLGLWLLAAYVILPAAWRHYEHHPILASAPKTTLTGQGIPGDPLNVGLIGSEGDVVRSMLAAGWSPADPITLRSSLRIAESVVFRRPDPDAPVSNLYLFGRRQDLAFEKPAGRDARRRHHVRYWRSAELGTAGVPLFLGSATFDVSVGLSHDTGQVTHHIAPDIDAQRDWLIADLTAAGRLTRIYQVTGVGATLFGRNGEGDRYDTDGELTVGVLAAAAVRGSPSGAPHQSPPRASEGPALDRDPTLPRRTMRGGDPAVTADVRHPARADAPTTFPDRSPTSTRYYRWRVDDPRLRKNRSGTMRRSQIVNVIRAHALRWFIRQAAVFPPTCRASRALTRTTCKKPPNAPPSHRSGRASDSSHPTSGGIMTGMDRAGMRAPEDGDPASQIPALAVGRRQVRSPPGRPDRAGGVGPAHRPGVGLELPARPVRERRAGGEPPRGPAGEAVAGDRTGPGLVRPRDRAAGLLRGGPLARRRASPALALDPDLRHRHDPGRGLRDRERGGRDPAGRPLRLPARGAGLGLQLCPHRPGGASARSGSRAGRWSDGRTTSRGGPNS